MNCTHLDHVRITELPESVAGCEDCLATGDPWLHLRICLECGKVGLLRRLAEPPRECPRPQQRPPFDPLARAGRGVVVVLCGRGRAADSGRARGNTHPAFATGWLARIFRKAGGFEDLVRFAEGAEAKHLSVSELEHPARGRCGLNAAGLTAVVNPADEQCDVAHAEPVVHVGTHDLPRIVEVAHVLPDAVMAAIPASLRRMPPPRRTSATRPPDR